MKKIITVILVTLSGALLLALPFNNKTSSAASVSQESSQTKSSPISSGDNQQSQSDSSVEDAWLVGNPILDQAVETIEASKLGDEIEAISNPTIKDLMYFFFASGEDPRNSTYLEGEFFANRFVIIGDTPKGEFPPLGASLPGYEGVVTTGTREGKPCSFSTTDMAQSTDKAEVIATWLALRDN
ncbi:hypothetical protein [Streptococcus saliviloxodontae]|uniref:Uncharacterized protein n=1 Tax=Streptococcus saliviloxodontae TaxID=1349416 RepID=A0ABS2PMJ6_9STRE|nr:hypothetical protein [Streptococcus saliviloxodontae]MBM7636660.1 hypothetical protein [Streptococcus saliviloxodontae]